MDNPTIEARRLRPHIISYIRKHEARHGEAAGKPGGGNLNERVIMGGAAALANQAGVHVKTIRNILGEWKVTHKTKEHSEPWEMEYVGFSTADKIISKGLGNPYLWRSHFADVIAQPIPLNSQDKRIISGKTEGKVCTSCEEWKEIGEFYFRSDKNVWRSSCKSCEGAKNAEWHRRKRKAVREASG